MADEHIQARAIKPGDTIVVPQTVQRAWEGQNGNVWVITTGGIILDLKPDSIVHRRKKAS